MWRMEGRDFKFMFMFVEKERVLNEKPRGLQLVKKFPAFYGT
jgi:hypothetical protein